MEKKHISLSFTNQTSQYLGKTSYTFDHEGPAVVNEMRDLNIGVFEHLDITSTMDVYQRVAYTQRIIRAYALKNYKAVLV